jgi:hypothetical protein
LKDLNYTLDKYVGIFFVNTPQRERILRDAFFCVGGAPPDASCPADRAGQFKFAPKKKRLISVSSQGRRPSRTKKRCATSNQKAAEPVRVGGFAFYHSLSEALM